MRITQNMLTTNLIRNLDTAQGRMDLYQQQMSSGYRVQKPSDDPIGTESILRIKSTLSKTEQWNKNASEGLSYMQTTDSTLDSMTSMLQRVRELVLQGSSDTLALEDQKAIAMEVQELRDQFRMAANVKVGTKYIFAGTKTSTEPMDVAYAWNGNNTLVTFEMGNHLEVPISADGVRLFQSPATTHPDGTPTLDIMSTLTNIVDALNTSDNATLQGTLLDIDGNMDNIISVRAELGARVNRVNTITSQLENMTTNLAMDLSNIRDTDMVKTIIQFQSQQNIFNAALSVGSKIIQPSLVDFMR